MILRKPYALLIQYFQRIHLVLILLCAYIFYKITSLSTFVADFLETESYNAYYEPVSDYINFFVIISIIAIISISIVFIILLHYKKKPWKIYLIPIIEYTFMLGILIFISSYFASYDELSEITPIMAGRDLLNIASGEFVTAKVLNIKKGEDGNPGKIQGTIEEQETIGEISKNTEFGIYGKIKDISSLNIDMNKEMEVALRDEIKLGKATILCSLDNRNVEEYEIEITKIYKENNYNNKSMEIKITDERLIEKTGGIIQGMSGSPIIQNGKFVGAVTHVLVNSATEGYAIFGDLMLKQSKEVD